MFCLFFTFLKPEKDYIKYLAIIQPKKEKHSSSPSHDYDYEITYYLLRTEKQRAITWPKPIRTTPLGSKMIFCLLSESVCQIFMIFILQKHIPYCTH